MTVYLDADDILAAARALLGHEPEVRDLGLLESALGRPRASMYGVEAYPDAVTKAAALMHSLIANHALVDGNKRLGVVGMILFLALNGLGLTMTDDDLYDLTMSIASGDLDSVVEIAERLAPHVR